MADSLGFAFLFSGIKKGLGRIADFSAILQQPLFFEILYDAYGEILSVVVWNHNGVGNAGFPILIV